MIPWKLTVSLTDKLISEKHNFEQAQPWLVSTCSVDVKIMIIHAEQREVFMSQSVTRVFWEPSPVMWVPRCSSDVSARIWSYSLLWSLITSLICYTGI